MSQYSISGNALLIESFSYGSYDELAKRYERLEGDLHVKGNGNFLRGFNFNTETDVNGKTSMLHTGLVIVAGYSYQISGMRKNNDSFGLLNTTHFIHHGIIKVLGNENILDRLFLEVRGNAGTLHNVGIEALGNGNVVRDPELHDHRKTIATPAIIMKILGNGNCVGRLNFRRYPNVFRRMFIDLSELIQIIGNGNVTCGLDTYVDLNIPPRANNIKENVPNISNLQPSNLCQNNVTSYRVQRSVEHKNNFIANTTQTRDGKTTQTRDGQATQTRDGQATQTRDGQAKTRDGQAKTRDGQAKTRDGQAKTRDGQAKTRDGQAKTRDGQAKTRDGQAKTQDAQVGISMATPSSQTENASSGHLCEGPAKTSQTENASSGHLCEGPAKTSQTENASSGHLCEGPAKTSQTEKASSGHLCEGPAQTNQTDTDLNSQDPRQRLVRELEILKTQRLCKVCFRQNACVTFAPCGHLASCVDCSSSVDHCPVCLSNIDNIVKTFIP